MTKSFQNVLSDFSGGRQPPIPKKLDASNGDGREPWPRDGKPHPRHVSERGEQSYSGAKPTKKLYRGGERLT